MIRRFIEWRIARHDARARVFAAATVAAQCSGDAPAAAKFHTQMCEAQAVRDGLRELVQQRQDAWGVRHLPNGDFEVVDR